MSKALTIDDVKKGDVLEMNMGGRKLTIRVTGIDRKRGILDTDIGPVPINNLGLLIKKDGQMSKTLTEEQWAVIKKVLASNQVQLEIGAENWDLTETEEELLWTIIKAEGLL